jgi:GT2 family glycosyltransferase
VGENRGGTEDSEAFVNSITIAICAYTEDRWTTLRQAIDAALKQTRFDDEILVIVDHNESLFAKCREEMNNCAVIPNRYWRGLSGARNTALEGAHGSIVVFLDDDAIPLDGWLDVLRASYDDKRVYGVGGLVRPCWHHGKPGWFPEEFLWVVGCSYRGLPTTAQPVRNPIGANMSFWKAALDSVGGFSESLGRIANRPLGCEETEFSIRLTRAYPDAILLFNPSAQVDHHVLEQRGSISYFARRCLAEGRSKAEVSRRVGRSSALSAERRYASRVLPQGIWQGLRDTATGDLWGAARSAMIAIGFTVTATGYCMGSLRRPWHKNRKAV